MAIEGKEIVAYIRIGLIYSIRTSYRSARGHPFAWGVAFFLLLLYSSFPSLFAFLASSSPVIACATLLLGLLLSYGDPNLPEIEEDEKTQQVSSLKLWSSADDRVVKRDDSFALLDSSSVEEDDDEEDLAEDREVRDRGFFEEREFSVEKEAEGALEVGQDVCDVSADDQGETILKVKIGRPASEENRFDSSLGSPWQPVDTHDASSDSESDGAESSSPDASMSDIIPMLDELNLLLDPEPPQPALKCMDEDEEAHEEKADGNEEAVKWTADDQKNVMDLGISEIERNRRLENLIARRRARKDLRFITERNLIDLDPVPAIDELSRFQARIPPISAPRWNPFDLPYNSEGTMDSPPIPGSAPSSLLPRHNPFDLPYDQVGHRGSLTTESLSHGEFLSVPQRDMFFQRHGSFSSGAPFYGELKQEKRGSRLMPYFVAERAEDTGFATFQRQLSEMSDSKVSFVPESYTASSVIDPEHHKELLEEELLQGSEMVSPTNHDAEPAEQESRFAEEVDSVDADHERSGINVGDYRGIDLNTSLVVEETNQAADVSRAVEEEFREGEPDSSISDAAKLKVIEDKHDELSSSSSLEADEKSFKMSTYEESVNPEPAKGDPSKGSSDSMHSLPADSNFLSMTGERVDDSQVADPVYDSSLSSIGKSLSNMSTFDEALFDAGKEGLNSSSSLVSDMQADISEVSSTPRPPEKNISSGADSESVNETMEEDLASTSAVLGVASSNLSSADENESRLGKIAGQIKHPLILSSVDTQSSEDSTVDVDFQSDGCEMRGATNSYSDTLVLSDRSTTSASEKAHPSLEKSAIQPYSESSLAESQISILNLPPIPEENLEDFKLEEEHESMKDPAGVVGLTGFQMIEEPDVGLYDIEQDLSFLQRKATEETEDIDNTNRLVHELEDDDASVVSPIISIHYSGLTGVRLLETTESMESSSLLDTKCEIEIKSHSASTDSRCDIIDEVQGEQEGGLSKMLNDSDDESYKEHAAVRAIEGIDEGLLSELDAVGDFLAEEVKLDGSDPEMELQSDGQLVGNVPDPLIYPVKQGLPTQLEVSEARSIEDAGLPSEANSDNLDELPSVANQPNAIGLEVGSSSWPAGVDPEMTVYNSKLRVLEACSFEELDSVFKQLREETLMSCGSEPIFEKSVTSKTESGSKERDTTDGDPKLTETDSELQVLEAQSIEDISYAFEQLSKGGLDKSVFLDVEPSESVSGRMYLEPLGTDSDLQVVEATSLEDIHLALKQLTNGTTEDTLKPMEPKDGSAVVMASGRHLEPGVLEVQSAEEIRLAFEAAVARETGLSHGQSDEKSHGVETMADVSSSGASTSRTIPKKDKSGKSSSSSGSSSSSSSSDSE